MNEYNFGDVVLVKFPFTDSSETKKRPALILKDTQDGDVIVNRITGQIKDTNEDIKIINWKESGLLIASTIRIHKIATINKKLIERRLGSLSNHDVEIISKKIKRFWEII
jgi:mRNA interferase MazF